MIPCIFVNDKEIEVKKLSSPRWYLKGGRSLRRYVTQGGLGAERYDALRGGVRGSNSSNFALRIF